MQPTQLLPVLQHGVPKVLLFECMRPTQVLTRVAASPLAIPTDDSVALIADDAPAFTRQLLHLLATPAEVARLLLTYLLR